MTRLSAVRVTPDGGLEGDHYAGKSNRQRQVTLIQFEHLSVIAALAGKPIDPEMLRRNLLVKALPQSAAGNARERADYGHLFAVEIDLRFRKACLALARGLLSIDVAQMVSRVKELTLRMSSAKSLNRQDESRSDG